MLSFKDPIADSNPDNTPSEHKALRDLTNPAPATVQA
jgi:hypothetical protein